MSSCAVAVSSWPCAVSSLALGWHTCRPQQALLLLWTCLTAADAGQQTGRPDTLCGVMQALVSDQHAPIAKPATDMQQQLEGSPALVANHTAVPETKAALPAPGARALDPATADTAQERYVPEFNGPATADALQGPCLAVHRGDLLHSSPQSTPFDVLIMLDRLLTLEPAW